MVWAGSCHKLLQLLAQLATKSWDLGRREGNGNGGVIHVSVKETRTSAQKPTHTLRMGSAESSVEMVRCGTMVCCAGLFMPLAILAISLLCEMPAEHVKPARGGGLRKPRIDFTPTPPPGTTPHREPVGHRDG